MISRPEKKISVMSQKSWKKHLQIMKNGLLYLDEAVYQYQKKTVRKMILKDHKRPDGQSNRPDPSVGRRSGYYSESTWFCYVYAWTDTDLYDHNIGTIVRKHRRLMD